MKLFAILWPTFALVALIAVIWFTLVLARMRHLKANPPKAADFSSGDSALRYFQPVELPANNLRNLFEMPVLFFALVPLLLLTDQASIAQVALAWAFVAARALHSYVHIVVQKIVIRATLYWVSCGILFAMWVGFFVDMMILATRYDAAIGNLTN